MATEAVSHGVGGSGNIGKDDTKYVDGEITRQAPEVGPDDTAATGRGGAGNIQVSQAHNSSARPSTDVTPKEAERAAHEGEVYHTGRGGQGNIHGTDHVATHTGLADKIKYKIFKPKTKTEASV